MVRKIQKAAIRRSDQSILPHAMRIFAENNMPISEGRMEERPGRPGLAVNFSRMKVLEKSITGDYGDFRLTAVESGYAALNLNTRKFVPLPEYEACVILSMEATENISHVSQIYERQYLFVPHEEGGQTGTYHAVMAIDDVLYNLIDSAIRLASVVSRVSSDKFVKDEVKAARAIAKMQKALEILQGEPNCARSIKALEKDLSNEKMFVNFVTWKTSCEGVIEEGMELVADNRNGALLAPGRLDVNSLVTKPGDSEKS